MTIYLDIETLPAPPEAEPALRDYYESRPSRARTFDEFLRGTSLSGNWGRILCIGVASDDQPTEVIHGDEPTILATFWKRVAAGTLFVGHNALDFDLPFIYKRSIVHRIKPSLALSFERYRSTPIYDTMREWDRWSSPSTSLHQLALLLGFESSKQGIDGSMVYDFYRAGKLKEIYEYCARDVELVRQIHRRLTFAE